MAGALITIRLGDLPHMAAALATSEARARNRAPLMDAIGEAMETSTHERFDAEQAPDGTPWAPTIRSREEGGQILRLDGFLDGSITHRATADQVEIGSNLIYAGVHQDGAIISAKAGGHLKFALPGGLGMRAVESVTIPARPYLGIGGDDEETIGELVADWLLEPLQ